MRRAIVIAMAGLAVFLLAALAGFVTAARIAPERLQAQAEQVLSDVTHARVTLGAVHLTWADELPWIQLRAVDAVLDWEDGGSFRAHRLSADLNPLSFAIARLDVRDVTLQGARWVLPAWPEPDDSGDTADLATSIRWLDDVAEWLRANPCPGPSLAIQQLSVWQPIDGTPVPLVLDAQGGLDCSALGFRGQIDLHGTLVFDDVNVPLQLELSAGSGETELVLSTGEAPIEKWARALHLESTLAGDIGGTLRWRVPEGGPQFLDLNLRGTDVAGTIGPVDTPALDLALDRPRLRLHASGVPRKLDIRFAELTDGNVALRGDAAFLLPHAGAAPFRARIETGELEPGDVAHLVKQLPEGLRIGAADAVARFESGTIERIEVGVQSTADGFRSITQRGILTRPGDLTLAMGFRDAQIQVGEADRVRNLNGRMNFDGDRLEVSELSAHFGGRQLARLDAALVGLGHLTDPESIRCDPPADIDTLPGLDSFSEWQSSRREPGAMPNWHKLRLELDFADHPLLLCRLEDVAAEVTPDLHGLDASIERATWAGLPIEANATYRGTDGNGDRVVLTATIGPPNPARREVPAVSDAGSPDRSWARGRFTIQASRLGSFRIRSARGELEAKATHLALTETALELDPGGSIEGEIEIELGAPDVPVYRAAVELADVALLDLWTAAGLERGLLSGHLHGAAAVEGPLLPNQNPLAHARGAIALHARSGEIHQKVPLLLALAIAGEGTSPLGDRDRITYEAIDLVGRVEDGTLTATNMTLTAKDLRGAASGTLDLAQDNELEMVIGVFFFPRLDGLIQKIPLLNRVMLGRDRNLVGAYFALRGPLGEPSARVLPSQSLVQGAGGVIMALPAFVLGGIQQIQSMVIPSAKPQKSDATAGS